MRARANVTFRGKVQGVFFRHNTTLKADEFGVSGWVRNMHNGSVQAVFEGEKGHVERLIDWCQKNQPHAVVKEVNVKWEDYLGEFKNFEVRY
jgi:acylphosphatase